MKNFIHESININHDTGIRILHSIDSGSFVAKHWHYSLELIYIKEGSLDVLTPSKTYHLTANQIMIINPKMIHSTICKTSNIATVLQIPYDVLKAHLPQIDNISFGFTPYSYPKIESHLIELINQLNVCNENQTLGYLFKSKSLLYELLFLIIQTYAVKIHSIDIEKSDKYFHRLQEITNYVKEHYHEPISLTTMSELVNLNPEYLSRFFKKYMGVTFTEYVNQIRIEHIYQELIHTDKNILDITAENGFYNYKHFLKMFKEIHGCTPLQKRKQFLKNEENQLTQITHQLK